MNKAPKLAYLDDISGLILLLTLKLLSEVSGVTNEELLDRKGHKKIEEYMKRNPVPKEMQETITARINDLMDVTGSMEAVILLLRRIPTEDFLKGDKFLETINNMLENEKD